MQFPILFGINIHHNRIIFVKNWITSSLWKNKENAKTSEKKKWPSNIQKMFFIIHAGEKTHIQSSRVPKCLFIYLFVSAKFKKKSQFELL